MTAKTTARSASFPESLSPPPRALGGGERDPGNEVAAGQWKVLGQWSYFS